MVAKFQSLEQLKKHRSMQGGVGRAGRRRHRDARLYGEAAAQRDRGKEAGSRGASYALLERAVVITKSQGSLRNFERG